jgi:hypothetical protein
MLYTTKGKAASSESENSSQEKTRCNTDEEAARLLLERQEEYIVRTDLTCAGEDGDGY